MEAIIYHNNACSKSRQAKCILEENAVQLRVIDYLNNPPSFDELRQLLKALNLPPEALLRKNEACYQSLALADKQLSEKQCIQIMIDNPILIERPIIKTSKGVVIGRPPEAVLTIL